MYTLGELNNDQLLNTVETAELLNVSRQFLEINKRRNGPPHVKIGPSTIRYKVADIRAWVAKGYEVC